MMAVQAEQVSKSYRVYFRPSDRLKELLTLNRGKFHQDFWALKDLTFELEPGKTLGVIGVNGSGKSTLLQIVAGILQPTTGQVRTQGRIAALLELGSGFNPEFTGRENVFVNGSILGLTRAELEARMGEIERFAEIGEFIDQPVKTYSSGLFVRLAFSVAINVDPDILIVDEALAVGDAIFQHRCLHKILEMKKQGKTILLVSHDNSAIKRLCDEVVLLDGGKMLARGEPDATVQQYMALVYERESRHQRASRASAPTGGNGDAKNFFDIAPEEAVYTIPNVDHRFGDGRAEILGIQLYGSEGVAKKSFAPGERMRVRITAKFHQTLDQPIIGFIVRDPLGIDLTATNTEYEETPLGVVGAGEIRTVDFTVDLPKLRSGNYSISPAVANGTAYRHTMCDWIDNAVVFSIETGELVHGLMRWNVSVRVQ